MQTLTFPQNAAAPLTAATAWRDRSIAALPALLLVTLDSGKRTLDAAYWEDISTAAMMIGTGRIGDEETIVRWFMREHGISVRLAQWVMGQVTAEGRALWEAAQALRDAVHSARRAG